MTLARALVATAVLLTISGHVAGQQQPTQGGQAPVEGNRGQAPGADGNAEGADGAGAAAPRMTQVASGDVERGRYLVEQVAMCGECHSTRDARGGVVSTLRLRGGPMPVSPPSWAAEDWPLYIPRIAGLPGYTDDQAIRLLTQGSIDREGRQLRPPMPRFRMTPQDAAAVVAYLRSR